MGCGSEAFFAANSDRCANSLRVFLRDVASQPRSPEAGVAHRINGSTRWFEGEFVEARAYHEQALAIFDPERDGDLAHRFGGDVGIAAMANLALTLWPLGEIDRARRLVDDMAARTEQIPQVWNVAYEKFFAALFEMTRGDFRRTAPLAKALAEIAREHDLALRSTESVFLQAWAAWKVGGELAALAEMRRGVALRREQKIVVFAPLIATRMAEAEAEAGEIDAALATIDRALADSERTGQRWCDAELHRVRGEILLKQDPANPAPAEEAFLTAIAIAQHQKARSFELRAALSLAKLYHATGRHVDAHDALGPALEGFAPTPEFPEIAEAQTLFVALAQSDEVKAATALRKQRVHLQVGLGNALIAARGYGAAETTSAFARARELARGIENAPERCSALHGLWAGSYLRGELASMRELADALMHEVEGRPESAETGVALRTMGVTNLYVGNFSEARVQLERALAVFDPARDGDFTFRSGHDDGVGALANLARTLWPLGETERARLLIDEMMARATEVSRVATAAYAHLFAVTFELMRRDFARAEIHGRALVALARDHDMEQWKAFGMFLEGWLAWRGGDREGALLEMRRGVAQLELKQIVAHTSAIKATLAEAEAEGGDTEAALGAIDGAIAESERTGQRWFDAEFHRTRGEILLEEDASNAAAAEASFLAAIAIAQSQKARSFELRAALSLARLYRATGRDADARAVLGPALEGFPPTPEFPEIGAGAGAAGRA